VEEMPLKRYSVVSSKLFELYDLFKQSRITSVVQMNRNTAFSGILELTGPNMGKVEIIFFK
jgi:hypothetical protein